MPPIPYRNEDLDVEIGARIRQARRGADISQATLGQKLGISYQQVQKYETGANRVAASTLVRMAALLGLRASDFLGENR